MISGEVPQASPDRATPLRGGPLIMYSSRKTKRPRPAAFLMKGCKSMKRMVIALLLAIVMLTASGLAQGESYPLNASVEAYVTPPEGYVAAPEMALEGEYYFVPNMPGDPVRFIYYTTGEGDPRALAETALESYVTFYDEFVPGEIIEDALAGQDCLHFDYTCAYPDRSGTNIVYEQTAIAYVPLDEAQFIACIISLAFDDPAGYCDDLTDRLTQALSAIDVNP